MQMLLFIVADLHPSGESTREGPAIDCEADTTQDGYTGILGAPESGGKPVRVSEGGGRSSHSDQGSRFSDVKGQGKVSSRRE